MRKALHSPTNTYRQSGASQAKHSLTFFGVASSTWMTGLFSLPWDAMTAKVLRLAAWWPRLMPAYLGGRGFSGSLILTGFGRSYAGGALLPSVALANVTRARMTCRVAVCGTGRGTKGTGRSGKMLVAS